MHYLVFLDPFLESLVELRGVLLQRLGEFNLLREPALELLIF
jgi:hypothetical protein